MTDQELLAIRNGLNRIMLKLDKLPVNLQLVMKDFDSVTNELFKARKRWYKQSGNTLILLDQQGQEVQ